jgi:threonine dehydrogenase-like Zn-dependent dehydrogenase
LPRNVKKRNLNTMRALLLTDDGPRLVRDAPEPQPHEALIRIRCAGICATDLALVRGYKGGYRGILGHEFVGEVVAAASGWIGQRVVGEINVGCGTCALCRRGLHKHCRARRALGIIGHSGAFADYITLPLANLHRVPPDLDDASAVFTEPLAAALQIPTQLHITPDTRVLLIGDGRLGLLIAQVLALTGCDLTVMGKHAAKLAHIQTWKLGNTWLVSDAPTAPEVDQLFDLVVEATGSAGGFATARKWVRPGGTLVLKSTFAGEQPQPDLSALVVDEVAVVGSRCGPFGPALRLLAARRIHVHPLIDARYALDDAEAALVHAGQPGVLKVLIDVV